MDIKHRSRRAWIVLVRCDINIATITRIGVFAKYCVYPQMVYRLAIVIPPPILDDRKSLQINTQLFLFSFFFTKWLLAAISDKYVILIFVFIKWLPAAILDDRKSLSIAFLTISDQYAIIFVHKMAASGHFG